MKHNGYEIDENGLLIFPDNFKAEIAYFDGCTSLMSIPDNFRAEYANFSGCTSLDYPIVHNCGNENRSIFLDFEDKKLIRIGCFKGTKEQAIRAVNQKYAGLKAKKYKKQIKECFNLIKSSLIT